VKAKSGASTTPHTTAPLSSRSRARLDRAARAAGTQPDGRRRDWARTALSAAWLLLAVIVAAALVLAPQASRQPVGAEAGGVQRIGPAEDDAPADTLPAISATRHVALAPAEEAEAPAARAGGAGLYLSTGGPPQPLRAVPDRAAEALVQVPDNAALDDLGTITPDGAWRRVAWGGWEGWIAAGLLRRQAE
jgi:hypothetical protein